MAVSERSERASEGRSPARWAALALAVALVGGPAVWFLHLAVSYWLVPVSCRAGSTWPMQVTTVVALVAGVAVVLLSARLAGPTVARGVSRMLGAAGPAGRPVAGGRDLLVLVAWILAVFFVVVVVGAALVGLMQRPCA